MYALKARSLRLCEILIRRGAHVNEKEGTDLLTVFKLTREGDDREIRKLLDSTRNKPRHGSMRKAEA